MKTSSLLQRPGQRTLIHPLLIAPAPLNTDVAGMAGLIKIEIAVDARSATRLTTLRLLVLRRHVKTVRITRHATSIKSTEMHSLHATSIASLVSLYTQRHTK